MNVRFNRQVCGLTAAVVLTAGCSSTDPEPALTSPASTAAVAPSTTSAQPSEPEAAADAGAAWTSQVQADLTAAPQVQADLEALAADGTRVFSTAAVAEFSTAQLAAALPQGSVLTVDAATWAPDGLGGGTVDITVAGADGVPTRYLALVSIEDAEWHIDATVALDDTADQTGGPTQ